MTQLEQLDKIVERLNKQINPAVQYITFLRDVADNPIRWDKYRDSFAGHVINMHVMTTEYALILLCDRVWDKGKDAQSVPHAAALLQACQADALKRRSEDLDAQFVKSWSDRQSSLFDQIISQFNKLSSEKIRSVLRVMRTENLAHLVAESRDRAAHFPDGFEGHGVTRYDLYDFSEETVRLIQDINLFVRGESRDFDENARVFKGYCESYWRLLPVFREAEKLNG